MFDLVDFCDCVGMLAKFCTCVLLRFSSRFGLFFLLSFFLGALGVDWFYLCNGDAAYIVAGVFKLLTLGIFYSSILLLRFLI